MGKKWSRINALPIEDKFAMVVYIVILFYIGIYMYLNAEIFYLDDPLQIEVYKHANIKDFFFVDTVRFCPLNRTITTLV